MSPDQIIEQMKSKLGVEDLSSTAIASKNSIYDFELPISSTSNDFEPPVSSTPLASQEINVIDGLFEDTILKSVLESESSEFEDTIVKSVLESESSELEDTTSIIKHSECQSNSQTINNQSSLLNSQFVRAESLVHMVEYVTEKDRYLIENEKEDVYLINLNDGSCTCIARKNCVHIMAVKMKVGLPVNATKTIKLTELKRNQRFNLRGGRKHRDNEPQSDKPLLKKSTNVVPNCVVCKMDQVKYKPCKMCNTCSNWVHNKCIQMHQCN